MSTGNQGLDALADAPPQHPAKDPDALLSVREVAALLGMSEAWVYHHASGFRHPRIPSVKFGKSIRFRRRAVLDFVAKMERVA